MKKRTVSYAIICAMLLTCFVPTQLAFAAISSVGTASYVNEQKQNNDALQDEQLIVRTSGSTLTIEGRTQLPPLTPNSEISTGMYVANFMDLDELVAGAPYIGADYYTETGTNGKTVYVFSGSCDFSGVADGNYLMYLWRAGKGYDNKYKLGSKYGKGILSYDVAVHVKGGQVSIIQYNNILNENIAVKAEMDAKGTDDFLDASLKDVFFLNRDPRVSGDKGSALTTSQMSYIKTQAGSITAGCGSDYEKVKKIYEFAAKKLYYDTNRDSGSKAFTNPYWNLYNINNKVNNNYNSYNGKAATECTGYSAMVMSMTRALGIPTRLVNGRHPAIEKVQWPNVTGLNVENHYWVECYVDGRWIVVDATMGTQNKYNSTTKAWTTTGISNYTYFDPTDQQMAVHYLVHGIYEVPTSVLTKVPSLKTSARSSSAIAVSWSGMQGSQNATGYYVQCFSSSGKKLGGMHVNASTRKYTFKKLGSSNTYKISVCGYGFANGEKIYGPQREITTCTVPGKVSIKTPTTGKTHYVNVRWTKRNCSGYQVMLATNSKFTLGKKTAYVSSKLSSKSITKLKKGKTYYVKVRAYKTINGKKYAGSWSSYKKIKCK